MLSLLVWGDFVWNFCKLLWAPRIEYKLEEYSKYSDEQKVGNLCLEDSLKIS